MSKLGFLLLLIGGTLQAVKSVQQLLDPAAVDLFVQLVNAVGASIGISGLGELMFSIITFATSITGVLIILGALIWFLFGRGAGASIGKLMTIIGVVAGIIALGLHLYYALTSGIIGLDPFQIFGHILGLGLGSIGVIVALIGYILGGERLEDLERDRYLE